MVSLFTLAITFYSCNSLVEQKVGFLFLLQKFREVRWKRKISNFECAVCVRPLRFQQPASFEIDHHLPNDNQCRVLPPPATTCAAASA